MNNELLDNESLINMLILIGKRLHNERHEKNEKIESVAHAIGISHPVLSKIEHGRYLCLSFEMLSRLACYYGMKMEELLAPE